MIVCVSVRDRCCRWRSLVSTVCARCRDVRCVCVRPCWAAEGTANRSVDWAPARRHAQRCVNRRIKGWKGVSRPRCAQLRCRVTRRVLGEPHTSPGSCSKVWCPCCVWSCVCIRTRAGQCIERSCVCVLSAVRCWAALIQSGRAAGWRQYRSIASLRIAVPYLPCAAVSDLALRDVHPSSSSPLPCCVWRRCADLST